MQCRIRQLTAGEVLINAPGFLQMGMISSEIACASESADWRSRLDDGAAADADEGDDCFR